MSLPHHCHAIGCEVEVPPRMLMCARHWRMVPRPQQQAVWRHFRSGQEADKRPSKEYLIAARTAIEAVAALEPRPSPSAIAEKQPELFAS